MATKKKTAAKKAATRPTRSRKQADDDEEEVLEPDEEEGFGEGTEEDEEPNDPTDDIEEELDEEDEEFGIDSDDEDEEDEEEVIDEDDLEDDEEVVVVKKAKRKIKDPLCVWPLRVRDRAILKKSRVVRLKARKMGYYGNKRRRVGEVFDMRLSGGKENQVPKWTVLLSKAKPGENEGSRGIATGNEMAVEHMRQRRGVREGLTNRKIKDKTIIDDALPLGQGGNARKPRGRGEDTVL